MQTNLRGLNIKYAFCNIGYLFLIVGTMGYAYNYLSQCGFSDGVAGTVTVSYTHLDVYKRQ